MNPFEYYSNLRKSLIEIISGVENSNGSLFWDNTQPNWKIKNRIDVILKNKLAEASSFGLLVVTRHSDCTNKHHVGYLLSNDYGLPIEYREKSYVWSGGQLYQGKRFCTCPCSNKNQQTDHWVIDETIYTHDANIDFCLALESILIDISQALQHAEDKRPRSAIREYLLRALLKINDQILPVSMDNYVEKMRAQNT